ncbi:MAG: carbamoyltransferase [Rhodospirillaceae bacterium]|nr:carbamoyltransferase [Rhodospirillaceae bacterium]MBT5564570.1 carbamoyltransferase [Rhodospirillaceae bacterium]MBT6090905.1 carbamoyltransferase [Rhodospirillaceae bacterium]MBT7451048.1 carbamoyltransferase [Rhodospirillaceae bacterium]
MRILGLSALYHDSAAALIIDGRIVAAAQEERFTRKKHDASLPTHSIQFCLDHAKLSPADIDVVAFYEKPFLKFERLLETYAAFAPRGFSSFRRAIPVWVKEKLFQKDNLIKYLKTFDPNVDWASKLIFSEHHLSHAASAFFPSPFDEAAILTMDGVGEWATTSLAHGAGNSLTMQKEIHFPHSLGLLYSAFTYYTGFRVNSGEYKVMGLAPYGRPHHAQTILDNLIDIKDDGTFRLDLSYFDYATGLTMTNHRFDALFGGPPRDPETAIGQREMDLAASIQSVTEEVVLRLARGIKKETGANNLCLAGGVALNCVANGKIQAEGIFERLWIQPAAGDAGGALGAALVAHHLHHEGERTPATHGDSMAGTYLGPAFDQDDIEQRLATAGAVFERLEESALIERTAAALADKKGVGWFQGRMEFGPRALGARSILGNPTDPESQRTLNLKVKFRESFRPFAPAVLSEDVGDWFELKDDSPYMLIVAPVENEHCLPLSRQDLERRGTDRVNAQRSTIPAVTHVDYSARVQTVHKETNPRFHALISAFKEKTGVPIVVNTSFNVRGEPIVCSPEDAFRCFMATGLDLLVIGDCILEKANQDIELKDDYADSFALD